MCEAATGYFHSVIGRSPRQEKRQCRVTEGAIHADLRLADVKTCSEAAPRLGAGDGAVQDEPCPCESDDDSRQDAEPPCRRAVGAASLRTAKVLLVAHAPLAERAGVAEVAAWAGAARRREAAARGLR